MEFTLIGLWNQMGGVAKAVGIILIFLSIVSLYLLIERQLVFTRARVKSKNIALKPRHH